MTRTLTAAAMLTALLFGAIPAQAKLSQNGQGWNGVSLNGLWPNGGTWNAVAPNALSERLERAAAQDATGADRAATLQIIGVELPAQGR